MLINRKYDDQLVNGFYASNYEKKVDNGTLIITTILGENTTLSNQDDPDAIPSRKMFKFSDSILDDVKAVGTINVSLINDKLINKIPKEDSGVFMDKYSELVNNSPKVDVTINEIELEPGGKVINYLTVLIPNTLDVIDISKIHNIGVSAVAKVTNEKDVTISVIVGKFNLMYNTGDDNA